jgi:hypothetical protein
VDGARALTRLTMMGEVAASIAHEINQPLGAIVNKGNVATRVATVRKGSLRNWWWDKPCFQSCTVCPACNAMRNVTKTASFLRKKTLD